MPDLEQEIQAFSVQHISVAEKLESGDVHRQPWRRSAAYTGTSGDVHGSSHRRAYLWMASQYAKRMGRRLHSAPIWMTFSMTHAFGCVKVPGDEVVLELRIPISEVLVSQYYRSPGQKWERVLWGELCCVHDFAESCHHVGSRQATRATWEMLFDLSGEPKDWQGIASRLAPEWVVGRISPGDNNG